MNLRSVNSIKIHYETIALICMVIMLCTSVKIYSQPANSPEHPPRPVGITINPVMYLNFGSFYHYGVGSVTVYPDGSRDRSGQVFLFSSTPGPGIFEVKGLPGTVISFLDIPDAILNGEFGGQLTLKKGETDPPLPYVLPSADPVSFKIGGILEVTNPGTTVAGRYDGVYKITVMQE